MCWCFIYFLYNPFIEGAGLKAWIQVPIEEMLFLCGCGPRFACSGAKCSSCCREGQTLPFLTQRGKKYFCCWGVQRVKGSFNLSGWFSGARVGAAEAVLPPGPGKLSSDLRRLHETMLAAVGHSSGERLQALQPSLLRPPC